MRCWLSNRISAGLVGSSLVLCVGPGCWRREMAVAIRDYDKNVFGIIM